MAGKVSSNTYICRLLTSSHCPVTLVSSIFTLAARPEQENVTRLARFHCPPLMSRQPTRPSTWPRLSGSLTGLDCLWMLVLSTRFTASAWSSMATARSGSPATCSLPRPRRSVPGSLAVTLFPRISTVTPTAPSALKRKFILPGSPCNVSSSGLTGSAAGAGLAGFTTVGGLAGLAGGAGFLWFGLILFAATFLL